MDYICKYIDNCILYLILKIEFFWNFVDCGLGIIVIIKIIMWMLICLRCIYIIVNIVC